ncbi:MAG: sensor histidine kinase [Roseiarcus sp.]
MSARNSLAVRLVVYWIVASALVFFTLPLTIHIPLVIMRLGPDPNTRLEWWANRRTYDLVNAAIAMSPEGSPILADTDALRAYEQANPGFRFAVIDTRTGAVLPGSSADLAARFARATGVETISSAFHLLDDPNPNGRGLYRAFDSPHGRLTIIVYGSNFHWDDLPYMLYVNLTTQNFVVYLTLAAVIVSVGYASVKRGLTPLRVVAAQAARIDMNSLNQRIDVTGLPSEVSPIVEAMNSALKRVDEGVARQRRFLANAAHELRTPITILCAHIENPNRASFEDDIKRGVYRLRTIAEQLLSAARLSSQGGAIETEVDLETSARSLILDYTPLAIEYGRNIELHCPSAPVVVRANLRALESALINLVENAVRAEPSGGSVLVRILPGETIEVVDHGEGVAPQDREAIFEPFWRKSDATPGMGLGLAITKELMERQGGRVWVEETPGGGATFKLSFAKREANALS